MMTKNNKISGFIILTVIFSLILLSAYFIWMSFSFNGKRIIIAGQTLNIKIAQTAKEQAIGLSQTKALGENQGMFFVYDHYLIPTFWMKDMSFSIDIIWLKDDIVMGYEKNLPIPKGDTDLPLYQPKTFINHVLEVSAGFVDKYGLKIGDEVKLAI